MPKCRSISGGGSASTSTTESVVPGAKRSHTANKAAT
jgi:hypothetical protein